MTESITGWWKVAEYLAELVRAENGDYLCDFCGDNFESEREARECGEADRVQWSTTTLERVQVAELMGFEA